MKPIHNYYAGVTWLPILLILSMCASVYGSDTDVSAPGGQYYDATNLEECVFLGRQPRKNQSFEPRVIDVDILLYDDIVTTDERLTIPHYELLRRSFFTVPLLEISPSTRPPNKRLLSDICDRSIDLEIKKIISSNWI